jgi:hypothetical protein
MNVSKFKLLGTGSRGLKATCIEQVLKKTTTGEITIKDEVERTRKVPVPWELKKSLNDLKYEFLVAIGRWSGDWSRYLNDNKTGFIENKDLPTVLVQLWENTKVIGLSVRKDGFVMTGLIRIIGHKTITENSPFITEMDEDYEIFDSAYEKIDSTMKEVEKYLLDERFMHAEPKEFLLDIFGDKEGQKERIMEQSMEASEQEMIDWLEKKNYVVTSFSEVVPEIDEDKTDIKELLDETSDQVTDSLNNDFSDGILPAVSIGEEEEQEIRNIVKKNRKKKVPVV